MTSTHILLIIYLFQPILGGFGSYQTPWYDKAREYAGGTHNHAGDTKNNFYWPYSNPKFDSINSKKSDLCVKGSGVPYLFELDYDDIITHTGFSSEIKLILESAIHRFNYFRNEFLNRKRSQNNSAEPEIQTLAATVFISKNISDPNQLINPSDEQFKITVSRRENRNNDIKIEGATVFSILHAFNSILQDDKFCLNSALPENNNELIFWDEPYLSHRAGA